MVRVYRSFVLRRPLLLSLQAAVAACSLVVMTPCVYAADPSDADARLSKLEKDIDTLNRAVYSAQGLPSAGSGAAAGDGGGASYQADLEVRISGIETQMRTLTGKIEQLGFENQQLREKLDKALTDTDMRLGDLEKKTGGTGAGAAGSAPMTAPAGTMGTASAKGGANVQTGTLGPDDMGGDVPPAQIAGKNPETMTGVGPGAGAAGLGKSGDKKAALTGKAGDLNGAAPADSPTQQPLGTLREAPGGASIPSSTGGADDPAAVYENAFSQLKNGGYVAAQKQFESFLKTYPTHPLAANATYWLGECYYAQADYDKASRIFAESYKKYPKGPKVADSLLKMGMSLGASGKTKEACVTLGQLKKEFPAGQTTSLRRADQEMSRLGCSKQ